MKNIKLLSMALLVAMSSHSWAADEFTLTSPDVSSGVKIKASQYWNNFGCTGDNERPQLNWKGIPDNTKSFAITLFDKDALTGSGFWHWVVYNIPEGVNKLDEVSLPALAIEGNTDMGKPGYLGPCPPVGQQHAYTYRLHALDVEDLAVPAGASAALTGFFIYQHTLAVATLSVIAGPRTEN
jgi:Raf kinase inhibitor-like YbhB/YbcL family protein